jgi:hypothetical protein
MRKLVLPFHETDLPVVNYFGAEAYSSLDFAFMHVVILFR